MEQQELDRIFDQFKELRVMVIGDVMIDAYMWGKVDRISPEAPVPVLTTSKKEHRLGGAANVAKNLVALGAEVIICSVVGNGERQSDLKGLFDKNSLTTNGLVYSDSRRTSVKTRVISGAQHVVRVDEEDHHDLDNSEELALKERISSILNDMHIDVIIFEDYNKGVLTPGVIGSTIDLANKRKVPTCVDPKKENFFAYKGVGLFKPNLKELAEGVNMELKADDIKAIGSAVDILHERINNTCTLLTLSEHGVLVRSKNASIHLPAHIRDIADVSGAGDTVISVAALCLALGLDERTIAGMANLAGGLVCESVGVVPIDPDRLKEECLTEL